MKLKLPARDGNTCYRPFTDSSKLRDQLRKTLSELNGNVQLSFEEIMVETSNLTNAEALLLNGRLLSDWIDDMDEPYRDWWETLGAQALESGQFDELCQDGFLKEIVTFVLAHS